MKQSTSRRSNSSRSGFTLVELLVVMGIIAILAGVLFTAAGSAIRAAQRAKAANTANQIQTAALTYYTEYSIYPVPSTAAASTDFIIQDTDAATWKNFIYGLSGNINPYDSSTTSPGSPVPNSRAIAFLNLKSTDVDALGGPKNPLPPNGNELYFFIAIDNDYDGLLGGTTGTSSNKLPSFSPATIGSAPPTTGASTAGIAVWANCNGNSTTQNSNFWVHTY
jgi:prepilin-type N-terminal cleavage/methylation domain-containing protein